MTWARITEKGGVKVVAEVVTTDPAVTFTPDIAALFVPATAGMIYMATKTGSGPWVPPPAPEEPGPAPEPEPRFLKQISPVAFLMMFTPAERVAIRLLRKRADLDGDPQQEAAMVVDDWMRIVEDPRLQTVDLSLSVAQAGIDFLVAPCGILTTERAAEIKQGILEA